MGPSKPSAKHTVEQGIVKPKKVPVELGYKGTMRPAGPAEHPRKSNAKAELHPSGTSRASTWADRSIPDRTSDLPAPGEKRYSYARYSDEEDDDDDDDEDEGSEDMEAHTYEDLEREEMESLRAARAEDAKALREENEHRSQKEKRKRALEELARSRKDR